MNRATVMTFIVGALIAAIACVATIWLTDPPVCPPQAKLTEFVLVGERVTTVHKGDLK